MQPAVSLRQAGAVRRLLVINPNSNRAVTDQIRRVAERVLWKGVVADVVNPAATPHAIESLADRAAAEPAVVSLIRAGERTTYDGYVLACFDDIAIAATRAHVAAPVICAVEASLALALSFATRPAIVTTVEAAVPGIRQLVARQGAGGFCSVRAAGIGVAAAATLGPDARGRLSAAIDAAINEDGADAIILGSGGLAGHASDLARGRSIPIIDSIEAAIVFAAAAAHLTAPARPANEAAEADRQRAAAKGAD